VFPPRASFFEANLRGWPSLTSRRPFSRTMVTTSSSCEL
jgi:hypothetical protein